MRYQKQRPFYQDLIIAVVAVSLGFGLGYLSFSKQFNAEEKYRLNQNLNKILDIQMEYPFLEDSSFIASWAQHPESNRDSAARYQTYCLYLLNFTEDVCEYYDFDRAQMDKFIDVVDLLDPVRQYWKAKAAENSKSYSLEFRKFVDSIIH